MNIFTVDIMLSSYERFFGSLNRIGATTVISEELVDTVFRDSGGLKASVGGPLPPVAVPTAGKAGEAEP